MNRHGMTGAALQQPDPPPLRQFAMWDRDKPCVEHATSFTGHIPCTGDYRCRLCGTCWDEQGNVIAVAVAQPRIPLPPEELLTEWLRIGMGNTWIARASDPPFTRSCFRACGTLSELRHWLDYGNWSVGTAFSYRDTCFINQDNGGGEWLVIRHGIAFESITWPWVTEDVRPVMLAKLTTATEEQCRTLNWWPERYRSRRHG